MTRPAAGAAGARSRSASSSPGVDVALIARPATTSRTSSLGRRRSGRSSACSFIGVGLFAWWRRPHNRFGALMTAVGFAWFLDGAARRPTRPALFTIGALPRPALHRPGRATCCSPSRRAAWRRRGQRRSSSPPATSPSLLVGLPFYVLGGDVGRPRRHQPRTTRSRSSTSPTWPRSSATSPTLRRRSCCLGAAAVLVLRKLPRATPAQRRQHGARAVDRRCVLAARCLRPERRARHRRGDGDVVGRPASFARCRRLRRRCPTPSWSACCAARYSRAGAVGELIERLNDGADRRVGCATRWPTRSATRTLGAALLARAAGQYVDADGRPVELPPPAVALTARSTEIERDGAPSAPSSTTPRCSTSPSWCAPPARPPRLALDNERLEAELRARVDELQVSRARLHRRLGLAERRRAGARPARRRPAAARRALAAARPGPAQAARPTPTSPSGMLDGAREELASALEELRELARGIHPAILTDRGLDAALEALAEPRAASGRPRRHAGRAPAAVRRGRRLLRRGRVADERRQVRRRRSMRPSRVARDNGYAVVEVARRRRRRGRPGGGHRPARPRRPPRGARRRASRSTPRPGAGTTRAGEDPMRVVLADDSRPAARGRGARCSRTRASRSSPRPATPRTCCARSAPTSPTWRSSTCACRRRTPTRA